jgi:hypothetical protein
MTYTIVEEIVNKDHDDFCIPVREDIIVNASCGDQIGISKHDGCLWFKHDLQLKDTEVRYFIENYFNDCIAVAFIIKGYLDEQ